MKDFAVIVAVYNEEKTIKKVVDELNHYKYPYIVVNDGSTDNTSKILVKNHIKHINIIPNQGKGNAIQEGADYLIRKGFDWVVIVDADLQTPIKDIDKLLKLRHLHPKTRIIIGNRLNNPLNMPTGRFLANKLMSWMVSLLTEQYIPDTQCGLKIISREVFLNLDFQCEGFDFDSEILLKAGRKGYKIVSGDIDCIYFKDRKSKLHPIRDTLRFIQLIFKLKV